MPDAAGGEPPPPQRRARRRHLAARLPRPRRRLAARHHGRHRRARGRRGRRRRAAVLRLLRPHLHDRPLSAPDRASRASTSTAIRCALATASRSTTSAARSTATGRPLDEHGRPPTDPDGQPLPPAPRTPHLPGRIPARYGFHTQIDGSWYRCCGGQVRRLMDCCARPPDAHQRRHRAHRLLLPGPQSLLRHVLPDERSVLSAGDRCAPLTAFVAGITGAWSPCGFSMVETLGSARSRRATRVAARAARRSRSARSAGGAITFTALAALGRAARRRRQRRGARGGGGDRARRRARRGARRADRAADPPPGPGAVAPHAAAAARGRPLRRAARARLHDVRADARGVGAGGDLASRSASVPAGLLIGLGFGAGRALPVVLMAPRYATLGQRLELKMAERPALLRRLRLADGALLAALAVAFLASGSASAARLVATVRPIPRALAPRSPCCGSAAPARCSSTAARAPRCRRRTSRLGGRCGGDARRRQIAVRERATGAVVAQRAAAHASQLAVSDGWIVWRSPRAGGGDRLYASGCHRRLRRAGRATRARGARVVAGGVGAHASIDRPALSGDRLAYATSTAGVSPSRSSTSRRAAPRRARGAWHSCRSRHSTATDCCSCSPPTAPSGCRRQREQAEPPRARCWRSARRRTATPGTSPASTRRAAPRASCRAARRTARTRSCGRRRSRPRRLCHAAAPGRGRARRQRASFASPPEVRVRTPSCGARRRPYC